MAPRRCASTVSFLADPRYAALRDAYDAAAERHGGSFGLGPGGARAKAVALEAIRALAPPGARLLDVGCDIGFEALLLARLGRDVTAIDISPRMLELAEQRRASAGVPAERCRFVEMAAAQVGRLAPARFDAAYSVYGALNLEPELGSFARGLAQVLPPGAPAVIGLLNPTALYEVLAYPFALRFKGWRKTLAPTVHLRLARRSPERVACRLLHPGRFARRMEPWFRLEQVRGLHVLAPPPGKWQLRHRALLRRTSRWDDALGRRWPWNRLGYFSLLVLRRTDAPVEAP
jgi:SAM-dependent methyltransferase